MTRYVGFLSYGEEGHVQLRAFVEHPLIRDNPGIYHQMSAAIKVLWFLGYQQASEENQEFLSKWVLEAEVTPAIKLQ